MSTEQPPQPARRVIPLVVEKQAAQVDDEASSVTPPRLPDQVPVGHAPGSTLEAIAMANVEATLTRSEPAEPDQPSDPTAGDKDLQEYLDIVERNARTAEWLFDRGSSDLSVDVRRLAARALGNTPLPAAIAALTKALSDDDRELRREAADALARLAAGAADPGHFADARTRLLTILRTDSRDQRIAAMRVLADLGGDGVVAALLEGLSDRDTAAVIQAIRSLQRLADHRPETADAFRNRFAPLLQSPQTGIRLAAA